MKKKDFLWCMLAFVMVILPSVGLVSCGGGDDPEPDPAPTPTSTLSVAPSELSLASNAGAQGSFTIASTSNWDISCSESWVSLSQTTGSGAGAIIVTAASENPNSTERTATITVKSSKENKYVSVKQAAADILTLSGLDATFDESTGSILTAQELVITCNGPWAIEFDGNHDWLEVSALSGTGKSTVKVWPNSANNSTTNRTVTLTVKSGSKSASKIVTQRAGLDANLQVSPKTIVVLSNGYAFDYSYGSNVKYYYTARYLPKELERKTDDEIISEMSADTNNRDTPNDSWVHSWKNQTPLTEYIICTVGYDQNGNHGALAKTSIKTKSGTNQAAAYISNVGYNDTYWTWVTTVNAYVTKYYMWFITRDDLHSSTEAAIAWFFKDAMDKKPDDFDPKVQGDSWRRNRNGGTIFHVATWAVNVDGDFSGVIENFAGSINSSRQKSMQVNYLEDTDASRRYKTHK